MRLTKKAGRTLCVCLALILCTASLLACDLGRHKEIDDNFRVYYEIFVRSFADGDSDGIGDLKGAREKLDYIAELGATGVWLMPIMPSETYHKYDVKDYMAIDPEYGTIDDFKEFVEACHKKNLRVVIDMDINHTSSAHPWFIAACDYLRSLPEGTKLEGDAAKADPAGKYVEYYNFSDEQVNGDYYPVTGTPYYYEGVFWEEMPDLNLSCAELKEELKAVCDFWLNLNVDGFRMDAAGHYLEESDDFNIEILGEIYEYCKAKNPDFYMVSEVWESEATFSKYYNSRTPSFFNFDLAGPEGKIIKAAKGTLPAEKLVNAMIVYENDFSQGNPEYIDAPFVTNHDMGRVANALSSDEASVKFAGGLNLIMRGAPFIYYGEEIGMKSKGTKDENKRLAMQWGDGNQYMCTNPPEADEGIEQTFGSLQSQQGNPDSIYAYYKNAIEVRRNNPAIARGNTQLIGVWEDGNVAAIKRTYGEDNSIVVINTGEYCEVSLESMKAVDYDVEPDKLEIDGMMLIDNSLKAEYKNHMLKLPSKSIIVMRSR